MSDDDQEGSMAELVPLDSEARHLPAAMTTGDWEHLDRCVAAQEERTIRKYGRGKAEHGGALWLKPGMLGRALDEVTDLPVYLWTLREQMLALRDKLRAGDVTRGEAADEIEGWLEP